MGNGQREPPGPARNDETLVIFKEKESFIVTAVVLSSPDLHRKYNSQVLPNIVQEETFVRQSTVTPAQ